MRPKRRLPRSENDSLGIERGVHIASRPPTGYRRGKDGRLELGTGNAAAGVPSLGRRQFCRGAVGLVLAAITGGCGQQIVGEDQAELVWGKIGISNGRFQKPRAIAIDADYAAAWADLALALFWRAAMGGLQEAVEDYMLGFGEAKEAT